MNDHMTVPFDVQALAAAIPGLDTQAGLACVDGNADLYRRLLCLFRDGQRGLRARVEDARGEGRDAELLRLFHTLKSNARSLGMRALGDAATHVEQALKDGEPPARLDMPMEIALIEAELMVGSLERLGPRRG